MTNKELELIAARGRCLGMQMVFRAASGHIGGSLSAMDILTELYFEQLRVDPERPPGPGARPLRHEQGPLHPRALLHPRPARLLPRKAA